MFFLYSVLGDLQFHRRLIPARRPFGPRPKISRSHQLHHLIKEKSRFSQSQPQKMAENLILIFLSKLKEREQISEILKTLQNFFGEI